MGRRSLCAWMMSLLLCGCSTAAKKAPATQPSELYPTTSPAGTFSSRLLRSDIISVSNAVARWQFVHLPPKAAGQRDWVPATFYVGLMKYASLTQQQPLIDQMKQLSQKMGWQLGYRAQFADDHLVGWTYLSLYERERDPRMIKTLKDQFDWQMLWPQDESLEMKGQIVHREWAWCDALFMSPPTWAKLSAVSGDPKYLQFMNRLWWKTADYLYDSDEHLFYRDSRFFGLKEANGSKVFWARGNGWVVGGLTRVLEEMPEDFPDRPRYVEMFRAMCERLMPLQKADGCWPAGLLDAKKWSDREVSGTAFFTYAFAWGVNHELLDRKQYLPAIERGWSAIVSAVHADGRIGWVQGGRRSTRYREGRQQPSLWQRWVSAGGK